jgi:hypothetical protein
MKLSGIKILALNLIILFPPILFAQQSETLVSSDVSHGGFGSILFGVTSVNGEASYLRGTRGAWVLKFENGHSLNLGLGSYRTQTGFDAVNWPQGGTETPELRTNYGGFELEYLNRSNKLIHYGVQAMIGGGTVRFRDSDLEVNKTSDSYFAFQPGANIHLNVTNWFKISGGLFYRYAGGVNLEGTGNSDLSGFSAIFGLRFGKF